MPIALILTSLALTAYPAEKRVATHPPAVQVGYSLAMPAAHACDQVQQWRASHYNAFIWQHVTHILRNTSEK